MNYAIIYWNIKDDCYPLINENGTLRLFDKLENADKEANEFEKVYKACECRVISIEAVKE